MSKIERKTPKKRQLFCSVFGHNFQVSKNITYHIKEYQCCHCKKEMTTNSKGNLTELTQKYKEINSVLERIHQNKLMRFNAKQLLKMSS